MKKITVSLLFVGLIYFLLITWVNLFPWNDTHVAKAFFGDDYYTQLVIGTIVTSLPIVLSVISFLIQKRFMMMICTVLMSGLLFLQIMSNWLPYIFGTTLDAQHLHEILFSRTLSLLPSISNHPVPDSAHTVLFLLYICILITMILSLRQQKVKMKMKKSA
ncbi:hypothetical protein [Alkalihalobacterium elongatum]|uniref:hypothetical protein n=1 Tax=Alkalihalobacterium elongatum TaxID=2675466 RepID=UPI001C1F799B|nr:hypothetical protein [Alkalihalobacterium elongatum]